MKQLIPLLIAAIVFSAAPLFAQSASPSPTPAASASPAKHKHKKAATAATSPVTTSATKATTASSPAATTATKPLVPSATPAPGGGHGLVWVNTQTHIYHKEKSKWYGRTKHGKYMSEVDALKEGDHAAKEGQ